MSERLFQELAKQEYIDKFGGDIDEEVAERVKTFLKEVPAACFNSMGMALMHEGTVQVNFTCQRDYIEANFEPGGGFSLMLVKNNTTPAEVLKLLRKERT